MSTNLGTLVVFALLEIINFSADSNFYDKYSLNNEKIINLKNKLIKNLHKFGELKWSSDFGVQLIEKFNQDIEYPSWIDKLQVKELIKN